MSDLIRPLWYFNITLKWQQHPYSIMRALSHLVWTPDIICCCQCVAIEEYATISK